VRLSFCIDDEYVEVGGVMVARYEASRPDATQGLPGDDETLACSRPGVLPWAEVARDRAEEVCVASGRRLCTTAEWTRACAGPDGFQYPYGNAYDGEACNGGEAQIAGTVASGGFDGCISRDGLNDMSGNVWEWIGDGDAAGGNHVLGGSYASGFTSLRCTGTLRGVAPEQTSMVIGFRCCSTP